MQLTKSIEAGSVVLCENTGWSSIAIHHDHRTMGALMNQAQGFPNCSVTRHSDWRLKYRVTCFYKIDNCLHHIKRNVLRQHHEATTPGDSFRHPSASDCCHIGNNNGNCRAKTIGRYKIDTLTRLNARHARHHKDIVVCQIKRWCLVEKSHVSLSPNLACKAK